MNHPTGTVTFLFTDIEGSTRLAQQYRAAWEPLRSRHHAILREAIEAYEGYVFQIIGDAFCAAFSTAEDAIRAAVQAQVDLNDEPWTEGACIKVRMGIHTGKAKLQDNGEYQGYLAMSRVQRLMSLAAGGQVLVSVAAQNQCCDDLPEDIQLRDLGEHRLKNIDRPERIYQLIVPGLSADFPPLQSRVGFAHEPQAGLVVKLMGGFEIRYDDRPVPLASRTAQSLFAYLILNPGVPQRREKLAGIFWPDEPEEKARAYLRHALWRIRKALAEAGCADPLRADDMQVFFDALAAYWLDAALLKRLGAGSSTDELMGGLSVSSGRELLPGFYEDWVTAEREHLQAVHEMRMAQLLRGLEVEKRWSEVIEWAERWIAPGTAPEAAYRFLMSAYVALGDRQKVAEVYERCVQTLHELGLEPSEQTRTLGLRRTSKLNIPVPLTSFIGREGELRDVAELISKSRLVTLTGSGGVGKTRLSIQVAAEVLDLFPDGAWFLDLAPVTDPVLVPNTLAGVLDLQLMGGDISMTELISGYLRSRQALILFDNCEHLVEACARLAESLLGDCPELKILATSREALRVPGEVRYRVPSLQLPRPEPLDTVSALGKVESVRLFVERAAVVSPGFAIGPHNAFALARICRRLDGIPLAIELAAARTNVLTVEQIGKRLDDRFKLLTGGSRTALPRQQTLRATIEWSYELLSEKERLLFRRLAVFTGGWALEAAEAVCSGDSIDAEEVMDLLAQLVDKSLVYIGPADGGETSAHAWEPVRYRRLDTIRQFACDKLAASGEEAGLRRRHFQYFLKLAQEAESKQYSPDVVEWVDRFEAEHENLLAALEWSRREDLQACRELTAALFWWWNYIGHFSEGYAWTQDMLAVTGQDHAPMRVKFLNRAGWLAWHLGYREATTAYGEESMALSRRLGDKEGMAFSLKIQYARALPQDYEAAAVLMEESRALYAELGNQQEVAGSLTSIGLVAELRGKPERARECYEEALVRARELGDLAGVGFALYLMGNLTVAQGDLAAGMQLWEESLQITRSARQKPHISWLLNAMGQTAIASGDHERGRVWLREAIDICEKMGDPAGMASSLHYLAWGARLEGDVVGARSLYTEVLGMLQGRGDETFLAEYLIGAGLLLGIEGRPELFVRLFGAARAGAAGVMKELALEFRAEAENFAEGAREALGEEAFQAAWAAGCQMSLEEGIALALKELRALRVE